MKKEYGKKEYGKKEYGKKEYSNKGKYYMQEILISQMCCLLLTFVLVDPKIDKHCIKFGAAFSFLSILTYPYKKYSI